MAGNGPPPKETRSRPRDAKARANEFTTLVQDDEVRGFDLPPGVLPDDADWHPMTVQFWETWRRAPQAQAMTDTDWLAHLDTALMHHVMWSKGRWEYASEIRLRSAKCGATVEDRLKLRMLVQTGSDDSSPAAGGSGNVTSIRSRRSRLTG